MSVFVDWTCPKCGRRFGARFNSLDEVDRPECPGCGYVGITVPPFRKILGPFTRSSDGFFRARRAAGLSFSQAAEKLRLSLNQLQDIEEGFTDESTDLVQRMAKLYGVVFEE